MNKASQKKINFISTFSLNLINSYPGVLSINKRELRF